MDQTTRHSLLDRVSALDDPRQAARVRFPLPEIILLLLCAALAAGGDDFVEMTLGLRLGWPRKQLAGWDLDYLATPIRGTA